MNATEVEKEFRAAEYDALRKEIMARQEEVWRIEKFALGGAAAIAAWLFTNADKIKDVKQAWWLPALFLFVCTCRVVAANYHLGFRSSAYLITTERYFLGSEGGWESWFKKQSLNETLAFTLVWGVALVAAVALGFQRGT